MGNRIVYMYKHGKISTFGGIRKSKEGYPNQRLTFTIFNQLF